jgi:hypothetical protein
MHERCNISAYMQDGDVAARPVATPTRSDPEHPPAEKADGAVELDGATRPPKTRQAPSPCR